MPLTSLKTTTIVAGLFCAASPAFAVSAVKISDIDANGDKMVSALEAQAAGMNPGIFVAADANGDGSLSRSERKTYSKYTLAYANYETADNSGYGKPASDPAWKVAYDSYPKVSGYISTATGVTWDQIIVGSNNPTSRLGTTAAEFRVEFAAFSGWMKDGSTTRSDQGHANALGKSDSHEAGAGTPDTTTVAAADEPTKEPTKKPFDGPEDGFDGPIDIGGPGFEPDGPFGPGGLDFEIGDPFGPDGPGIEP